jgi:TonB family protein
LANQTCDAFENNKHSGTWLAGVLTKIEARVIAREIDFYDASQCIASVVASTEGIDGAAIAFLQDESLICIGSAGLAFPAKSVLESTSGITGECISSGRMVWCRNATANSQVIFGEDVPAGVHSAIALPLWQHGRVRGVLAVFAGKAGHLGPEHMTALGTAADIAGLLEPDKPVITNKADVDMQAAVEPISSDSSGAPAPIPQGVLAELLADENLAARKHSRVRVPLFVFAGLLLVLLCAGLLGGAMHLRLFAYPNYGSSSHVEQQSAVDVEVGDPVLTDSANVSGRRKLITTGGKLKRQVSPIYPADALKNGVEGTVNVLLLVNERGLVEDVRISNGDPLLASAVISALGHWRYSTFYTNNRAVAVSIPVQVTFQSKLPLANYRN